MRLIDADALKHSIEKRMDNISSEEFAEGMAEAIIEIKYQPTIEPEQRWIPFKTRPMDKEERQYWEEHFGFELSDEDAMTFDCKMPDDGQEILVSYRNWISMDKCEIDDGCYGLEGNGDWEDVIAWMPCPDPYKEDEHEVD